MKLKTDFVTNSSSTCYVAFVPAGSQITFEEYMNYSEDYYEDDAEQEEIQEELNNINRAITDLAAGREVWNPEYDGEHYSFWALISWLREKGFIITSAETGGGDGMDSIVGLPMDKIKKVIMEHSDMFSESVGILKS